MEECYLQRNGARISLSSCVEKYHHEMNRSLLFACVSVLAFAHFSYKRTKLTLPTTEESN